MSKRVPKKKGRWCEIDDSSIQISTSQNIIILTDFTKKGLSKEAIIEPEDCRITSEESVRPKENIVAFEDNGEEVAKLDAVFSRALPRTSEGEGQTEMQKTRKTLRKRVKTSALPKMRTTFVQTEKAKSKKNKKCYFESPNNFKSPCEGKPTQTSTASMSDKKNKKCYIISPTNQQVHRVNHKAVQTSMTSIQTGETTVLNRTDSESEESKLFTQFYGVVKSLIGLKQQGSKPNQIVGTILSCGTTNCKDGTIQSDGPDSNDHIREVFKEEKSLVGPVNVKVIPPMCKEVKTGSSKDSEDNPKHQGSGKPFARPSSSFKGPKNKKVETMVFNTTSSSIQATIYKKEDSRRRNRTIQASPSAPGSTNAMPHRSHSIYRTRRKSPAQIQVGSGT